MAKPVDQRGKLAESPFSYQITKSQKVFIQYFGKQVVVLRGAKASRFIDEIDGTSQEEAQLVLARYTGNFKRGNERAKK